MFIVYTANSSTAIAAAPRTADGGTEPTRQTARLADDLSAVATSVRGRENLAQRTELLAQRAAALAQCTLWRAGGVSTLIRFVRGRETRAQRAETMPPRDRLHDINSDSRFTYDELVYYYLSAAAATA